MCLRFHQISVTRGANVLEFQTLWRGILHIEPGRLEAKVSTALGSNENRQVNSANSLNWGPGIKYIQAANMGC